MRARGVRRQPVPASTHPAGPVEAQAWRGCLPTREDGLTRPDARIALTPAPTAAKAAKLILTQLRAALKRNGHTRFLNTQAERLRNVFSAEYACRLRAAEEAFDISLWRCPHRRSVKATDQRSTHPLVHVDGSPYRPVLNTYRCIASRHQLVQVGTTRHSG